MDPRGLFVLRQFYEGSFFGDCDAIFGTQSHYGYVAKTGRSVSGLEEEDEEEDKKDERIMRYLLPKDRFIKLLSLYPDCASWITSRALHRRNYFRQVELTFNMRFGVDSRFDFLRSLSLNPERRAQFDDIILRKVNQYN